MKQRDNFKNKTFPDIEFVVAFIKTNRWLKIKN